MEAKEPVKEVSQPSSGGSGMGARLGIILFLFALLAGGIVGLQFYLDAQIPKPDPNVVRPEVDDDTDMGSGMTGGMPQAPGA